MNDIEFPIINYEEYERLNNLEHNDSTVWDGHFGFRAHTLIKKLFKEDKHIQSLIFTDVNPFSSSRIFNGTPGYEIPEELIDHKITVSTNDIIPSHENYTYDTSRIHGLFTFPKISKDTLLNEKENIGEFWDLFVLNPELIHYKDDGTVGLFLCPTHKNQKERFEEVLMNMNGYIEKKTDYPLFLRLTNNEDCTLLVKTGFARNHELFVEWLKSPQTDTDKMFRNLVDFWGENPEVSVKGLNHLYEKYMNGLYPPVRLRFNRRPVKSSKPFKVYNPNTGDSFESLTNFMLDLGCNTAFFNDGGVGLSDEQIQGFENGEYVFDME